MDNYREYSASKTMLKEEQREEVKVVKSAILLLNNTNTFCVDMLAAPREQLRRFFKDKKTTLNLNSVLNQKGQNAVHFAIENGWYDKLQLLFDFGADVDSVYKNKTPIHIAAEKNDTLLLDITYEYGANPDSVNENMETPLQVAISLENDETITRLLQMTTAFRTTNDQGRNLLHYATNHNCIKVISELADRNLIQELNVRDRSHHQLTPLHLAVIQKRTEIVKQLFTNNIKDDQPDGNGLYAIHHASSLVMINTFTRFKQDVFRRDPNGKTIFDIKDFFKFGSRPTRQRSRNIQPFTWEERENAIATLIAEWRRKEEENNRRRRPTTRSITRRTRSPRLL